MHWVWNYLNTDSNGEKNELSSSGETLQESHVVNTMPTLRDCLELGRNDDAETVL